MAQFLHTLRTIAVTATVTSAAWVIAGSMWMERLKAPEDRRPPMALMAAGPSEGSRANTAPGLPARLLIPVAGVRREMLVDTFTQARDGGLRVHDAIDIMAPHGTPVIAAAGGRVEKLYLSKQGGNTVYLRSPDQTIVYYYAHLDSYQPGLAEGQQLAAGAPLGTVGSTGNADPAGPHLHFAILQTSPGAKWWDGALPLNPYPLLMRR